MQVKSQIDGLKRYQSTQDQSPIHIEDARHPTTATPKNMRSIPV
jgi:hypothetical protein